MQNREVYSLGNIKNAWQEIINLLSFSKIDTYYS